MTLYKGFIFRPLYRILIRLSELNSISSQDFVNHSIWYNYSISKKFSSNFITTDSHNTNNYQAELAQCNNYQKTFNTFYTFKNELTANNLIATLYHLYQISNKPINNTITTHYKYWKDSTIGDYSSLNHGKYKRRKLLSFPKEISDIYSLIKSRLNKFNTRQLLFLAHATKLLELPHSKEIQRHVSNIIIDQLWVLEPLDFIRAGDSLLSDHEFSKLYLHVSLTKYKEGMLDPSSPEFDLFKIITSLNTTAPILLKELYSNVQFRINEYNLGDLIYILTRYSQHYHKNSGLIINILTRLLKSNLQNLDLHSISDLVWSAAKLYNRTKISKEPFAILDTVKPLLDNVTISQATPNRLAMLIWAYSTTIPSIELMELFLKRALDLYDFMDPTGLANTLYGLSITIPELSHELFDRVDSVIIENVTSFNTMDLSITALAYCNVKGGTLELHSSMADVILELGTFISSDCLVKIIYTYGTLNCCSNVIYGLIYSVLERLNQFTTHGISIVLWGFSIFKFFDVGTWEAILPLIECDRLVSDSKCALLYPALVEFSLANPDIMVNLVKRLLNLSMGMYVQWQMNQLDKIDKTFYDAVYQRISEYYKLEESIELLDGQITKRFTMSNIVLDIAFRYEGILYGILLFDKSNTNRISKLPLGQGIQRDRLANSQGGNFKTIRILYEDFKLNGMCGIIEQM